MQSYSVAQGQSVIFSAYGGSLLIIIYNDSLSVWMDAGRRISTTSIPVTNTWYYVTYVHQTNGLCSLYLNNQLVGTYTKSGGLGTSLAFCLGTYDAALNSPFNGYIDDFRLYNTVVNNIPAIITVGNPTYVSGVVGSSALSLANTAGGTATQYVRAPWSGAPNFTVSFWFNPQTLNGVQQQVFAAYAGNFVIYISALNQVCIYVYNGTTSVGSTYAPTLSTNTWYFITAIFQSSGLSSFYVNNTLVGTFTSGLGSFTTTQFGLGCNDNSTVNAFNGYIDDVRIYPSAIPYSPMIASNYTACAVSGSGQYLLASSTTGRLLQSTDSGITWTHNTQGSGPHQSLTELALSHTGQYATSAIKKVVTPNTTAATALTYVHPSNGLTWTVSASSNYVAIGSQAYYALNDSPAVGWTSAANYSTAGVYNNTYSTTVQTGVGTSTAVAGEWIQIQSATPVTLTGFNFVAGYPGQVPSAYTICGSMNGQTWYLLQTGTFTANPITSTYGRLTTTITMNYTGTQSLKGDITTAAVTTTASQYTAGAYTYFRWIMPSTFATGSITTVAFGELYPQFQTATVQPQLTGLTT
jgi:hypothetical protein